MVRPLSLAQHTLYADLLDQGGGDLFDPDLPENGSLLVRGNRAGTQAEHAYYQGYRAAVGDAGHGQRYARYLGRADDPEVAARIARFRRVKAARAERTITVRALIGTGMQRPDRTTGRIIEALARAGLFPDHAVLIGRAACQTYDGVLGVRSNKPRTTTDMKLSALEIAIRDSRQSADILAALRTVDPSFAAETETSVSYRSAHGDRVTVDGLDHSVGETFDRISFLMTDPVSALVLYGPGIPVTVPAPERFAAHALIVAGSYLEGTTNEEQAQYGFERAADLIDALLSADRTRTLSVAFANACRDHPHCEGSLREGIIRLPDTIRTSLSAIVRI